jgi:hypothetical protein
MTPAEFWHLYDHHQPETMYGSMRESEVAELLAHLEAEEAKWQQQKSANCM